MLLRLFTVILLAVPAISGEFFENWKPGKTEKMKFEIKTIRPMETTNYSYLETTRLEGDKLGFKVSLFLDIPGQKIKIYSNEVYEGENLRLVSSNNYFDYPQEFLERMQVDSALVDIVADGDSLKVKSNNKMARSGTIFYPENAITGLASSLKERSMNFEIGAVLKYQFVNLIQLTGREYSFYEVRDSVIELTAVNTPLGPFECYKVENTIAGTVSYIYYTSDSRHLPVKLEFLDPADNNITMTHTLIEYK
jgi:hypothetical protein